MLPRPGTAGRPCHPRLALSRARACPKRANTRASSAQDALYGERVGWVTIRIAPLPGQAPLEDAPRFERVTDLVGGLIAVDALRSGDRPRCKIGHRRAVEVELPLEDDGVGLHIADRVPDVPERARPDASVGVDLPDQVLGVVQVAVD